MTFDKFTSRVTIRGQIIAATGLHVGAGSSSLDPSASDSPVIRDTAGRPFIPGSSFKGALRAHLESLVRGAARKNFQSCDLLALPCLTPDDIKTIKEQAEEKAKAEAKDKKRRTVHARPPGSVADRGNS